jgi:hypothetical protein
MQDGHSEEASTQDKPAACAECEAKMRGYWASKSGATDNQQN